MLSHPPRVLSPSLSFDARPLSTRLTVINLTQRGIETDFGPENADTFRRADYVLANPPFNDSDWFRKNNDVR